MPAAEDAGLDAVIAAIDLIAVFEVDAPILHLLVIQAPAEHQVLVPGPDAGSHHAMHFGGPRFVRGEGHVHVVLLPSACRRVSTGRAFSVTPDKQRSASSTDPLPFSPRLVPVAGCTPWPTSILVRCSAVRCTAPWHRKATMRFSPRRQKGLLVSTWRMAVSSPIKTASSPALLVNTAAARALRTNSDRHALTPPCLIMIAVAALDRIDTRL